MTQFKGIVHFEIIFWHVLAYLKVIVQVWGGAMAVTWRWRS